MSFSWYFLERSTYDSNNVMKADFQELKSPETWNFPKTSQAPQTLVFRKAQATEKKKTFTGICPGKLIQNYVGFRLSDLSATLSFMSACNALLHSYQMCASSLCSREKAACMCQCKGIYVLWHLESLVTIFALSQYFYSKLIMK